MLGQLFNANSTTGFLQISFAQLAPNSDKERELYAAFLSTGVHVNVKVDSGNDIKELPTPVQAKPVHSGGKKNGGSLSEMTEAIKGFTEVSRARLNRSTNSIP